MKRLIDAELVQWKSSPRRKPLILRGARQVGKTWSLKAFGAGHFDNIALIDLERQQSLSKVFDGDLSARRMCADLELLTGQKISPGKTLLFFDEIQAAPRAITALRYFYEEMPDLHVVAAGSLLEFALREASFPVGRVQFLTLHPLCFAEYLEATGRQEASAAILHSPEGISPAVHEMLCNELRRYFFVGGMPACVNTYQETASFQDVFAVQKEIVDAYRMDFVKYTPQVDRFCLDTVFSSVSQQIGVQIKYSRLGEEFSGPTLKKAFQLLCLAQVIRAVRSADPSGLPLGATASSRIFKALMLDIGLMRSISGMPTDVEYARTDLLAIYRGAMAEQFVGQEMAVTQDNNLHYWNRQEKSSTAEVDYLAVVDGRIHPVEVKSGASGSLKSLHLFLSSYPNCGDGLVFSSRPYAALPDQKITFMPLYSVFYATRST